MYLIEKRWVSAVLSFEGNGDGYRWERVWPHTHHKPFAFCTYKVIFHLTLPSVLLRGVMGFLQTMSSILNKFLWGISQNESKAKVLVNIHQRRTSRGFQTSFGVIITLKKTTTPFHPSPSGLLITVSRLHAFDRELNPQYLNL